MNRHSFWLLLVLFVNFSACTANAESTKDALAEVSLIRLKSYEPVELLPASDYGFVLVALHDCSLLIGGRGTILHRGDIQEVKGSKLSNSTATVASLVLVKVRSARQNLTVETVTLTREQELEDASGRNATLLIAIDPLRLRDVRNLAVEGEPWKSGKGAVIELSEGQTQWVNSGMHRMRNLGDSKARFVFIEW